MLPDEALEMVVRTDVGRLRKRNEDAVFADAGCGLAILADGMGGYKGGDVASGMAVALLVSGLPEVIRTCSSHAGDACGQPWLTAQIGEQIAAANLAIFNTAQKQPQYACMGTTLVLACFYDAQLVVAHVGDSRLYRLRGSHFEQLTRDHSILQDQIDSGLVAPEDAHNSSIKNLVTRALGAGPTVDVDMANHAVEQDDIFLLCSDGLSDMLKNEEIRQILLAHPQRLEAAAGELIEIANHFGGRDNVSVILIKVRRADAAPRGKWQKLLAWLK